MKREGERRGGREDSEGGGRDVKREGEREGGREKKDSEEGGREVKRVGGWEGGKRVQQYTWYMYMYTYLDYMYINQECIRTSG